jgi:alpha-1,3-rhamnosyl/mannosyltransferase
MRKHGICHPYFVVASAKNWKTKNLVSALEAIELTGRHGHGDFQVVVFGPPDGFEAAGGQERWPSLRLIRTGFASDTELAGILRHATAFIMPSLYEGFGLPVLEAMSCGCPVITSNGGALAEIAGAGARVFAPFDVHGMAAALSELLANPAELGRWRAAALGQAGGFSWQKAACETMSVYHRTRQRCVLGNSRI